MTNKKDLWKHIHSVDFIGLNHLGPLASDPSEGEEINPKYFQPFPVSLKSIALQKTEPND